ncbi:hypothetical protein ACFLT5_01860 [Chloroflexota bacterium]
MIENRFSSGVVCTQTDGDLQVMSSGPCQWLRDPGFAGALLSCLAKPLFLDSTCALLPTLVLSVLLVVRDRLEDRTLYDELQGYLDYAKRVRYRLLPGLW